MSRAVLTLAAVALAGLGWSLPWPDPAQAGAALQWCAWVILCALAPRGRPLERAAAWMGVIVGVAGAGCATWWGALSQLDGVCDAGTGRPVTAVAGVAVLVLAAQVLRELGHDDRPGG